ncbi:MAG: glycosyltransferase family 39 protein [Planctomycetaceae bacterium]
MSSVIPDPVSHERRLRDLFPWVVLAVACAVRVTYFVQYCRSPLMGYLRADHVYYVRWARQIAEGDWLGSGVFQQAPLYPYLLGLLMSVIGERPGYILASQLLIGAASCVLLYGAARRLWGRPTALIAGLLMATYGPGIFYECLLMKSFLSPVLTIASLYCAVRFYDHRRFVWIWLAGCAIGLACLVAENHILLLLPVGLWLWRREQSNPQLGSRVRQNAGLETPRSGECDDDDPRSGERGYDVRWRTRLIVPAQLVLATAVTLLPSLIRNLVVAGELIVVTSGGGEVFYLAHGPTAQGFYSTPAFVTGNPFLEHEDFRREAERRLGRKMGYGESSRYWAREAFQSMWADPARTARLTGLKAAILFNDYEAPDGENFTVATRFIPALRWLPTFGWIGGLGVLGACLCVIRWRTDRLVLGMAAVHIFTVVLLYNFGRFRLGLMPLWIILAAVAITWLAGVIRSPGRRAIVSRLLGVCLVVAIGVWMFGPPLGGVPPGHRAGQAISTADLALRQGNTSLAATQFREVLAIYRDFDQQTPKIARLVTTAHLELARLAFGNGDLVAAGEHLQIARRLPNRDDVRERVLSDWIEFLRAAQQAGLTVPEVGNFEEALTETTTDLAALRVRRDSGRQ